MLDVGSHPGGWTQVSVEETGRSGLVIGLDLLAAFEGASSAEHGIGQLKRDSFLHYTPDLDINLMRQLKAVLDPNGIMNPGKLL